jgi:hypothetical protein
MQIRFEIVIDGEVAFESLFQHGVLAGLIL